MGAPGYIILCSNGHEIGNIDNGIQWTKETWKELETLESSICKCRAKARYTFCHYGDINDCQIHKLTWNVDERRWIIPKEINGYDTNRL